MAQTTRRVFVELREVPGLLAGVLVCKPVALRRVLGARRAGRMGIAGLVVALAVSTEPAALPLLALAHVALSVPGSLRVGVRPYQRLVPWALSPLLIVAAFARLAGIGMAGAVVALCVAHALLWLGLRALGRDAAPV